MGTLKSFRDLYIHQYNKDDRKKEKKRLFYILKYLPEPLPTQNYLYFISVDVKNTTIDSQRIDFGNIPSCISNFVVDNGRKYVDVDVNETEIPKEVGRDVMAFIYIEKFIVEVFKYIIRNINI